MTPEIQTTRRWATPWLLAGALLVALAALNVFTWWLKLTLDPAAVSAAEPALEAIVRYFGYESTGDSIAFAIAIVVGAVVLSRDPSNRFAWVLGTFSGFWMVAMVLIGLAMLSTVGRLPVGQAPWMAAVGSAFFLVFLTGTFLIVALFPTGSFPSGRWRPVLRAAVAAWTILAVLVTFHPGSPYPPGTISYSFSNPLGVDALAWAGPAVIEVASTIVGLLSLGSLVGRYRTSDAEVRTQIKWVVAAMALLGVTSILMSLIDEPWSGIPLTVALWLTVGAIGLAILKYRLYEIDVIINRAIVYAALALFIGVVYIGVVVGMGSLLGSGDEPNVVLSVGATALVAVGFQPVRRWLERIANRLVFGRKATPYEVLSDFSRRVAATSDSLLDDAARSLAEGTRAERVAISVNIDGQPVEAAAWPAGGTEWAPNGSASFPITDRDVVLGSLDVFLPDGQALQDDDRRLAEQLASGMGLALRNQLLTERLEARVEELRESRRRLVAVQDETRRRLERDLHDGAQQQLVALKVKLGLGTAMAEKDGATQTAQLLARLSGDADAAVDAMREFARGVYPPLLEAEGLVPAISAQARRADIPIAVDADGIGRYPREIESTIYFCVLEALRNTMQHAGAGQATITLSQANGALQFEVTDDGTGFDPQRNRGLGLTAMADRLDALTGELTVHTVPGQGTTITGTIPVPDHTPVEAPS